MDRARPSYSAATTVTVATGTYRIFLLSATEESLELVLTLWTPFRSHASSFTIARIRCTFIATPTFLTTPFIALAGTPATVSACSLNCSALDKFGSEFGR